MTKPLARKGENGLPPRLDRELAGPLCDILGRIEMPLTAELIASRRAAVDAANLSDDQVRCRDVFELEETFVVAADGYRIPLIVCRPAGVPGPVPVIYNTHGGGMVAGGNRTIELAFELERAEQFSMAVVAVEYRLAPEHPDPTPIEDCYRGLQWVAEHAQSYGFDPCRIVVSGNSAGGGLAAGVSLLARDRGGPVPLGQMLQCPMLDDRCDYPSASQMANFGLWDGTSDLAGWTALLGARRGTDCVSPYAAPARATDLSSLPPAFIDVGSVEALRDSAVAYATRIWQAGGDAELHVWPGAFHCFDWWVPDAAVSRAAKNARVEWLRRLLSAVDAEQAPDRSRSGPRTR